jgi:hypothetical protein
MKSALVIWEVAAAELPKGSARDFDKREVVRTNNLEFTRPVDLVEMMIHRGYCSEL